MSLRIGVLGGGQLGRMMALAGYPLGLSFSFFDKAAGCPSAALGERFGDADYSDESLQAFIDSADVFTYEFENIPTRWVEAIAARKPVYPGVKSLAVSQNRLNEKRLFAELNIPSARYAEIRGEDDLRRAVTDLFLETARATGDFAVGLTDPLDTPARPRWPLDPAAETVRGAGVKA